VTAEPYAAATGLIERFAGAYSSAVPTRPRDDGLFGPASVTWRVSADLSAPVAGLRSLLMQALHPLVMAGVDQHSGWRRDPVGRLAATSAYVAAITYGDTDSARRAAQRVRAVHENVRGTDTVTGRPYAALDPPGMEEEIAELWQHVRDAAVTALPDWARDMCRCPAPAGLASRRRTEVRQALGMLDAAILGVPGVLPARQRLTRRVRSARCR